MGLKTKKFKKSAFSFQGYTPFKIVEEKVTKTTKKKGLLQKIQFWKDPKKVTQRKSYRIQCGPLKENQKNLMDLLPNLAGNEMTKDMIDLVEKKWIPNPQLTVFDHQQKKPLTAAEAIEKRQQMPRWLPMYFQNPMQSYDYLVYESLFKNTILGPIMIQFIKFLMGTGFKPGLELRHPTNDPKADKKQLESEEAREIISNLEFVDKCLTEKADDEGMDVSFKQKISGLLLNMFVFNRSCAIKTYDRKKPIKINDKPYPNIPTGYTEFHPRDIGIVKISPENHKMVSVQIQQINGFVDVQQMLYFWNSEFAAPIHLAKYYGGSMMMPMIEPARLVRNQISSILPAVSENMAGGLYHIFVEPEGGTEDDKQTEYESITQAAEFGTSNVFMISPDRVQYENVNFDPKIQDLIAVFDSMIKYLTAAAKLPQIGFYDESAANHATAVEKIQLTITTSINPVRENIGEEIARQHYSPIFKEIYKDKKEILEKYRLKVEWDDLQVETLKERAEAIGELHDIGIRLDPEKLEETLQIDSLAEHMEIEKPEPMQPGQEGPNNFKVKNQKTGEKFNVKSR